LKELSATGVGVQDVRAVLEEAKNLLTLTGRCVKFELRVILLTFDRKTILFLDEVHRFNKGQQVRHLRRIFWDLIMIHFHNT